LVGRRGAGSGTVVVYDLTTGTVLAEAPAALPDAEVILAQGCFPGTVVDGNEGTERCFAFLLKPTVSVTAAQWRAEQFVLGRFGNGGRCRD
jgi:hypothetical protein